MEYVTSRLPMQIACNIFHFILICILAPWIIGAGHSLFLGKFDAVIIAGVGIVVFSFPVTFSIAVVSKVMWRFFDASISPVISCFSGFIIGIIMGYLLGRILDDNAYYFVTFSAIIGILVGYIEYFLFSEK